MISRYSVKSLYCTCRSTAGNSTWCCITWQDDDRSAAGYELSVCTYRDNRYGSKSTGGGE